MSRYNEVRAVGHPAEVAGDADDASKTGTQHHAPIPIAQVKHIDGPVLWCAQPSASPTHLNGESSARKDLNVAVAVGPVVNAGPRHARSDWVL